jgi:hypothetical protein
MNAIDARRIKATSLSLCALAGLSMAVQSPAATRTYSTSWAKGDIYSEDVDTIDFSSPVGPAVAITHAETVSSKPGWPIGLTAGAKGTALANHGVLKISNSVNGDSQSDTFSRQEASFGDTILIDAPGMTGKVGTFKASMTFNWAMDAAFNGSQASPPYVYIAPRLRLRVETFGQATVQSYRAQSLFFYTDPALNTQTLEAVDDNNTVVPFSNTLSVNVPFAFGRAFSFDAMLSGITHGSTLYSTTTSYTGSLSADHSAYWAGTAVSLDGSPVTNYSVASSSGTDWTQSFVPNVPEPQTWALLLGGLVLVGTRVSRVRAPGTSHEP